MKSVSEILSTDTLEYPCFGGVHLWTAQIANSAAIASRFGNLLSSDEQDRAAQFHRDQDRDRFVACRSMLRHLLGCYLNMPPAKLRFEYNAFGKPSLAQPGLQGIEFNLSHSGDWALFAFTSGIAVGVDVECLLPEGEWEPLVSQALTPEEQSQLAAFPVAEQRAAFFRAWTRKEAVLKAMGTGLSTDILSFETGLMPSDGFAISISSRAGNQSGDWWLADLSLGSDVAAAVAVAGKTGKLIRRDLGVV